MQRECELCGETDSLDVPGDPSGKIRICSGCGFVHVKERRHPVEVAAAWSQIYASGGYDPEWPGVRARLYYVALWIQQHVGVTEGDALLDIGAGNGWFLDCMPGWDGYGLEPTGGIPVADIYAGTVEVPHPEIDGRTYDLITINWTLENTADPLAMLRYARSRLAEGGHVVVATGSRIGVPFKKRLSAYLPQDQDYPHDTHASRWSANSLERAAMMAGLGWSKNNDYDDRDEMVCAFTAMEPLVNPTGKDNPAYVRDFFARWLREFP